MSLGVRTRVLIAYLEFDASMILDSVCAYSPDVIITFHNIFQNKEEFSVRNDFASYIQNEITKLRPSAKYHNFAIEEIGYQPHAKSIESIIDLVNGSYDFPEILINISTGPNEFSAAAAVSSVVHENVTIFSTAEIKSNIPIDIINKLYRKNGVPEGCSSKIQEPTAIHTFKTDAPSKPLVLGLRLLDDQITAGKPLMAKDMIALFIEKGIWMRERPSTNDNVFYLRDFVDKWVENGWVVKGQLRNQYRITEKGRMILDTYYNISPYLLF